MFVICSSSNMHGHKRKSKLVIRLKDTLLNLDIFSTGGHNRLRLSCELAILPKCSGLWIWLLFPIIFKHLSSSAYLWIPNIDIAYLLGKDDMSELTKKKHRTGCLFHSRLTKEIYCTCTWYETVLIFGLDHMKPYIQYVKSYCLFFAKVMLQGK